MPSRYSLDRKDGCAFQKVIDRIAMLEIDEQHLNRNAGAAEAWRTVHAIPINPYHLAEFSFLLRVNT